MEDKIKVFALGGLDEDGKNLQVVEINNDIFVIECGIRFPDKTTPGIDYIIPDYDYLRRNKQRVKAYILTHGHDDEIGALPYIHKEVPAPIYGSDVTLIMVRSFFDHIHFDASKLDLRIVKPTSDVVISGRTFHFFHTAHNIAESMGVAIETTLGNIVFTGDYVVENNASEDYLHDMNAIARIAEKETVLLMTESNYADRLGYTAPKYKITPVLSQFIEEVKGRLFIALFSRNIYNIDEVINLAVKTRKKIAFYDSETAEIFKDMQKVNQLIIPKYNFVNIEDINRVRAGETIVLMCGFGDRLFKKIATLANGLQEDRRIVLTSDDTFVVAAPASPNVEAIATAAIDDLYRSGVKVRALGKKDILKMHASEEDIKMVVATLKPKYYLPVKGSYRHLLANAQLVLGMGLKLSHQNVFVLDNGMVLEITKERARILQESVKVGDLLIDGKGIGDVEGGVITERQKLSDDGVIVLGVTISKSKRQVIAGPDVQMRGFVFLKDSDTILKEVTKIFLNAVKDGLNKPNYRISDVQNSANDAIIRYVRRANGKNPMVLPLIIEID
ncbi:MAG: ribonuclease J [Bacilli bacterium]|jgi:ribonuclease J|nr:ribonuclease J [Bacilli bacterium]